MPLITDTTYNLNNLTAATPYQVEVRAVDAAGNESSPTTPVAFTTASAGDTTAPVISNVSITDINQTSVSFNAQLNEAGTIYWAAYPTADAPHTKGDILAGIGARSFGFMPASGSEVATTGVTNLLAATPYKVHYFAEDNTGNETGVFATAQFATTAQALTGRSGPYANITEEGYLVYPYGQGLNPHTQAYTIEFWFMVMSQLHEQVLFSTLSGTNQRLHIGIALAGTQEWSVPKFSLGIQDKNWVSVVPNINAERMVWKHAALTLNAGVATLYIDHQVCVQKMYAPFTLATNFRFGDNSAGGVRSWLRLDGVKVWNKVLTAAERLESANYADYAPRENLLLNTNFDDNTFSDLSGNGYHPTPTATTVETN